MGSFHYPPSSFETRFLFDEFCFLSAWTNVEREPELTSEFLNLIPYIAGIKAKVLFFLASWSWLLDLNVFECWSCEFDVVPVRATNSQGERYTVGVG